MFLQGCWVLWRLTAGWTVVTWGWCGREGNSGALALLGSWLAESSWMEHGNLAVVFLIFPTTTSTQLWLIYLFTILYVSDNDSCWGFIVHRLLNCFHRSTTSWSLLNFPVLFLTYHFFQVLSFYPPKVEHFPAGATFLPLCDPHSDSGTGGDQKRLEAEKCKES